ALLDARAHIGRRRRDEADRDDALHEPLLVDRLLVLEEDAFAPFEQAALREERLPTALLAPRRVAFERIDDLREGRLPRVPLVARVPDQRKTPTRPQDAMDLV